MRPSSVHNSNIFNSETAWPLKAKFYVVPPWEGGTKVYINGPGHMTKMATMPIYMVKTFKNLLQNQRGGGVAQWLGRRISDQGVPGLNPGRCTFRCGLEQVTFTLLSTG